MNRTFFTAPAAMLVSGFILFGTASPASAAESCQSVPTQIREAAATADASTAKRVLGYASIGEKLCEAGNDRAANKKFAAAAKTLNVDVASLTAVTAAK